MSTGESLLVIWYFGESVDNYDNGQFKDHGGSFTAGVDGAYPGIWIKAKQVVGDVYRQEYYRGKAEDMRKIVAVDRSEVVNAGGGGANISVKDAHIDCMTWCIRSGPNTNGTLPPTNWSLTGNVYTGGGRVLLEDRH